VSLESGKKLCFISSLITIIAPIAAVIACIAFFIQLFNSLALSLSSDMVYTPSGSIFLFQTIVVGSAILSMVSLVLFIVGMYYLSKYYDTPKIFNNILKALLINIVATVIIVIVTFISGNAWVSSIIEPTYTGTASISSGVYTFLIFMILIFLAAYAIAIFCAILYKRAFDALADKSGVGDFKTAGLLTLIGAIIPIGVLSWIGWIFAAMGYNKLKSVQPQTEAYPPQQDVQTIKYCSHCGVANVKDASYCYVCGCQIQ